MCQVRPETWRQWHGPQAGSTMFLSPGEQVSVENLLHGIVTLSGNDATVVLAECLAVITRQDQRGAVPVRTLTQRIQDPAKVVVDEHNIEEGTKPLLVYRDKAKASA